MVSTAAAMPVLSLELEMVMVAARTNTSARRGARSNNVEELIASSTAADRS